MATPPTAPTPVVATTAAQAEEAARVARREEIAKWIRENATPDLPLIGKVPLLPPSTTAWLSETVSHYFNIAVELVQHYLGNAVNWVHGVFDKRGAAASDVMRLPAGGRFATQEQRDARAARIDGLTAQLRTSLGSAAELITPEKLKEYATLIAENVGNSGLDANSIRDTSRSIRTAIFQDIQRSQAHLGDGAKPAVDAFAAAVADNIEQSATRYLSAAQPIAENKDLTVDEVKKQITAIGGLQIAALSAGGQQTASQLVQLNEQQQEIARQRTNALNILLQDLTSHNITPSQAQRDLLTRLVNNPNTSVADDTIRGLAAALGPDQWQKVFEHQTTRIEFTPGQDRITLVSQRPGEVSRETITAAR